MAKTSPKKRKPAAAKPKSKTKTKAKPSAKKKSPAKAKSKAKPARSKARPVVKATKAKPAKTRARVRALATASIDASDVRSESRTRVEGPDWRVELRAAVEAGGPDFAAYLTGLGLTGLSEELPWEYADMPELIGLEQWGTELATRDRRAGIGALVRVAQHGLPIAIERGGIGIEGMGFRSTEPTADGAPVETQIALAAAWLDTPDRTHLLAVAASIDRTRQLQIWDDDLIPNDDRAHWWYLDVGQCLTHAITRTHGTPDGPSYYEWPPEVCVGRGLVIAVRGLRYTRASIAKVLADVRDALLA